MSLAETTSLSIMEQAVDACTRHVDAGGLPFVGVLVSATGEMISEFGVNRVRETGDPTAHAEVVAMRDAMTTHHLDTLAGTVLLATGEPCGLCYRHAIDHGVETIHVAVDRDEVADFGFDYRSSYRAFDITDTTRAELFRPLPAPRASDPFNHYLRLHLSGRAFAQPGTLPKGTPS